MTSFVVLVRKYRYFNDQLIHDATKSTSNEVLRAALATCDGLRPSARTCTLDRQLDVVSVGLTTQRPLTTAWPLFIRHVKR